MNKLILISITMLFLGNQVNAQTEDTITSSIVHKQLTRYKYMEEENRRPGGSRWNVPEYDSLSMAIEVELGREAVNEQFVSFNNFIRDNVSANAKRSLIFDSLYKSGYWPLMGTEYKISNEKIVIESINVCHLKIKNYEIFYDDLEKKGQINDLLKLRKQGKLELGNCCCGASIDSPAPSGLKSADDYFSEIVAIYANKDRKLKPPFSTLSDYSKWEKKNNNPQSDYRLSILRKQFLLYVSKQ